MRTRIGMRPVGLARFGGCDARTQGAPIAAAIGATEDAAARRRARPDGIALISIRVLGRLALLAIVLVAAGCGNTKTLTVTSTQTKTVTTTQAGPVACTPSDLSASFDVQPGSAGAGNITYVLKMTNTSTAACVFTPSILQLLDANGGQVPTHAQPASIPKTIAAGGSASYEARFSPDVTGVGDNTNGACEPVASTLQVTVGSGTVNAPIKPPTSVCEQGSIQFRPPT